MPAVGRPWPSDDDDSDDGDGGGDCGDGDGDGLSSSTVRMMVVIVIVIHLTSQGVKREHSGNYTCRVANTEGEGVSNVVALAVQCEFDGDGDFLLALSFTN